MEKRLISQLNKSGLSSKESIVYAHLISTGGGFPSGISEETKLNRSTTYKMLLSLSVKGLISEIRKGKKLYYFIDKPNNLVKYSKDKLKQAERSVEEAATILPNLEEIFKFAKNKPTVQYFDGLDALLDIMDDVVSYRGSELVSFSNLSAFTEIMPSKNYKKYIADRINNDVKVRLISPDNERDKRFEGFFSNTPKKYIPEIKYIPLELFGFEGEVGVYGVDKVFIMNYKNKQITLIFIQDVTIHGIIKMAFELAWNSSYIKK